MALVEMAMSGNGYVTASQATEAGIPRRKLTEAVGRGDLVQVARGLYALPETWEDPYLVAQHRFARGVFSDDTALFLHGMTDRAPFSLTMTFPRGYNATPAREAGIVCRTCADDVLDLGITELTTQHGNVVRAWRGRSATWSGARARLMRRSSPRRCNPMRKAPSGTWRSSSGTPAASASKGRSATTWRCCCEDQERDAAQGELRSDVRALDG